MTHKQETHIAFDFGTKSIGIAIGQTATFHASELPPIKARDGIPNWDQIETLLKEWQPCLAVVGLPINMDGTEQPLTQRARKFGNRINGRFNLPVHFADERLSTREAKEEAFAQGHRGNFADKPIDSIAARIILESWWNEQAP